MNNATAQTESRAATKLAIGILNLRQAADVLDVDPVSVKRLIALGRLQDNRNKTGSVVMQPDLQRFIGAGSQDLKTMPPLRGDSSWFDQGYAPVSINAYVAAMRASEESLTPVSDAQVLAAIGSNRLVRNYTFDVPASAEMKAAFRKPWTPFTGLSKSPVSGLPFGVVAMISTLQSLAESALGLSTRETSEDVGPLTSHLWSLYSSPEYFRRTINTVRERTEARLSLEFRETRTVERYEFPKTVIRRVSLASISGNLEADFATAIRMAF